MKLWSLLILFFNFFVWLWIFWKFFCVWVMNFFIFFKLFLYCVKWLFIVFFFLLIVFISFLGSFLFLNFFIVFIKLCDLVLSKGVGFVLFVGVLEFFFIGIWDELFCRLFFLFIFGLFMGFDFLDEGFEGSFWGCEGDKFIIDVL